MYVCQYSAFLSESIEIIESQVNQLIHLIFARFFLLVDLREFFFSDLVSRGRKKINKKALKMTS